MICVSDVVCGVGPPARLVPAGPRERLSVGSSPVGFARVPSAAITAHARLEGGSVRYTLDGLTGPTSSEGRLLWEHEMVVLVCRKEIDQFRAVRVGPEPLPSVLDVEYQAERGDRELPFQAED